MQISEKKLTQYCNCANFRCVNDEVFVKSISQLKYSIAWLLRGSVTLSSVEG